MEARFGCLKGVVRTRVGYTGGLKSQPSYYDLGDHTETVRIDYDPTRISYRELLDIFWSVHDPTSNNRSVQYKKVVFYHNDEQRLLAEETREAKAREQGRPITTAVLPVTEFTPAEDYHQKYILRNDRQLAREYQAIYPDLMDFINSTAVSRVNGYLGGCGTPDQLSTELNDLGLSPDARERLKRVVDNR
jgi:peptide-methionine (S)-S-oxide reductase